MQIYYQKGGNSPNIVGKLPHPRSHQQAYARVVATGSPQKTVPVKIAQPETEGHRIVRLALPYTAMYSASR